MSYDVCDDICDDPYCVTCDGLYARYFSNIERGVNAATSSNSNSADADGGLSGEVDTMVGTVFSTGNSTVKQLPVGTMLMVSGPGQLEVVDVPAELGEGDRFESKYGPATIVRLSSRLDDADLEDGEVLYIADGTTVVRRAFPADV